MDCRVRFLDVPAQGRHVIVVVGGNAPKVLTPVDPPQGARRTYAMKDWHMLAFPLAGTACRWRAAGICRHLFGASWVDVPAVETCMRVLLGGAFFHTSALVANRHRRVTEEGGGSVICYGKYNRSPDGGSHLLTWGGGGTTSC